VTFLSLCGFSTPFFTAIFSSVTMQEWPGKEFFISAPIVFLGLYLFYKEELVKNGIHNSHSQANVTEKQ
jgi:drug/metabolite transporter (DMT)-like permease